MINFEPAEPLSIIVHRDKAYSMAGAHTRPILSST